MNVPKVVTVAVPVFVNRPDRVESTVSETEVTEPEPAEGLTHVSEEPVEERYCPDVPIVERPVPPKAVGNGPPETLRPPAPNATGPDALLNENGAVGLLVIVNDCACTDATYLFDEEFDER